MLAHACAKWSRRSSAPARCPVPACISQCGGCCTPQNASTTDKCHLEYCMKSVLARLNEPSTASPGIHPTTSLKPSHHAHSMQELCAHLAPEASLRNSTACFPTRCMRLCTPTCTPLHRSSRTAKLMRTAKRTHRASTRLENSFCVGYFDVPKNSCHQQERAPLQRRQAVSSPNAAVPCAL